MRTSTDVRPFRLPRPILRLINTDGQLIWLIVTLWALASGFAALWLFAR